MDNFFKAWLKFDDMITPNIIVVVYWVLIIGSIIGNVSLMFFSFLGGLIGLIFSIIGIRVLCELIILSFNVYKCVKKIADNIEVKPSNNE